MIIVGAGIVGASFAYHAYQNGVDKITVLSSHLPGDKNQATSNTWGWVNGYASNDKSYATFRLANLNYWPKLINYISSLNYTSKGAFIWDQGDKELQNTIKQHQSWGQSVKISTKSELNKHLPYLNNIPTMAGFGVDDLAIDGVRATKELFKASGSKILKTKVKEIICDSNNVTGVKTDDEIINDNEVILTAGLGAPKLLSTINIPFEMHSSLGLLVYTKPLPQLLKYPITGFDFHARQDDKGRLIIGGKFDDDSSQEENIKGTAKKLIQDMATRLNYNGNMILDHFTLGKRPLPVDGRPKIGRLINQKGEKLNGIYLAVIYTVGHIFIAMTCNRLLTGAPLNLAAIDALIEPLVNGFWFYLLFEVFNKYKIRIDCDIEISKDVSNFKVQIDGDKLIVILSDKLEENNSWDMLGLSLELPLKNIIDNGILPNEVNWLENFVDYFKGCFMGQEQTSRVKYRGRPRRILKTLPNSTQEIVKI